MKIGYRLPLAMLCALSIGYGASAATPAGSDGARARGMDATQMTQRMGERLELDSAQSASVQKINERFVADMQKQRSEMAKAREAHMKAMEKLSGERDAQLKKVLNEGQYSKYSEQRAAKSKRWRTHRDGMSHPCDGPMHHGEKNRSTQ